MHNYCINKLLNLKEVKVKNIVHADSFVKIFIHTEAKEQICPCCGATTKRIHDYRNQTIKDLPLQEKNCYLILRKRRYRCIHRHDFGLFRFRSESGQNQVDGFVFTKACGCESIHVGLGSFEV